MSREIIQELRNISQPVELGNIMTFFIKDDANNNKEMKLKTLMRELGSDILANEMKPNKQLDKNINLIYLNP